MESTVLPPNRSSDWKHSFSPPTFFIVSTRGVEGTFFLASEDWKGSAVTTAAESSSPMEGGYLANPRDTWVGTQSHSHTVTQSHSHTATQFIRKEVKLLMVSSHIVNTARHSMSQHIMSYHNSMPCMSYPTAVTYLPDRATPHCLWTWAPQRRPGDSWCCCPTRRWLSCRGSSSSTLPPWPLHPRPARTVQPSSREGSSRALHSTAQHSTAQSKSIIGIHSTAQQHRAAKLSNREEHSTIKHNKAHRCNTWHAFHWWEG